MRPECKVAVSTAAKLVGRKEPTEKQYQAIEDQMLAKSKQLAMADTPRWRGLTREQQLQESALGVMQDIKAAAQRKLENAEKQILRVAETDARIKSLQESFAGTMHHDGTRAEALKRDFVNTHIMVAAERKIAQGGLMDLIEATGDKQGAGMGQKVLMSVFDAENPQMTRDIVKEIFKSSDGHTGNQKAQLAAKAWLDTIEGLRTRFNAAGGDVGKLDYGYVPQPHDTARVRKAGADGWVEKTAPLVDRNRYLKDDGSRMNDDELKVFLKEAYQTLATEGLNKSEPGAFTGTGSRANRGSDSRQIHFADGDAWSAYMKEFGRGSIYDSMMAHIGGITRDIALVERYGPDAAANARLQFDIAAREDNKTVAKPVGTFAIRPQTYWDMISGKVGAPVDTTFANTMSMIRNLQTAAKLGGAVISSVTDLGTLAMNTGYNRLPYWQLIKDIGSQHTADTKEFMSAHGMIAESVASEMNRWSGDHIGSNWSGKLANSVLKWSLLNAWTDGLRQGFTMTMNAGMAKMAKSEWGDLNAFDRSRLTRAGFTESDWGVLNGIAPTEFKGRELLTPQSIKESGHADANSIAAKVFGFIHDESEYAVLNPDMATRAVTTWGGTQAGTFAGELSRTASQLKSFPIAMITRHWSRMLEGDHGTGEAPALANRLAYGMALMATGTALGAVALQEKQVLKGLDPQPMNDAKFWMRAVAQGGGLSIVGDTFLVDPAGSPGGMAANFTKTLAGPTIGTAGDLALKVIAENIWQASEGKDSHWLAEAASFVKAQTPAANLWWVKPAIEHGFTNAMNESLSPGYLSRMQQRAQKDTGAGYWWKPSSDWAFGSNPAGTLPQRAPDMSSAAGR